MDIGQTLNRNKAKMFINSLCYNLIKKKKWKNKMKTSTKKNILFVFLTILTVFPIILVSGLASVPKSAQAARVSFVSGSGGVGATLDDWDPAIATSSQFGSLEPLVWLNYKDQQAYPALATSWTLHPRADEGSNTGGVAAISFNLRQNVYFMDGLKWNATVCKWNYDRNTYITGQNVQPNNRWQGIHWFNPASMASRFTPNWNLSWAFSDPFGNGGKIPVVNETIIVSEYVVNFTLNKWVTLVQHFTELEMMSSLTYKDFATTTIRGYSGQGVLHCVGTGAYQFVFADNVVTQTALAVKNENYWNKDFLEAQGLFVIDDAYTRWYATTEARSTALLAGDTDSSGYQAQNKLTDMAALSASPYHKVYKTELDASYATVQFLGREGCDVPITITSGPFVAYSGMTLRDMFPLIAPSIGLPSGTQLGQGLNKTVRQAVSWAFDYDDYINVQYADIGAVRCDSPLGTECAWNDHTVPYYEYNLTIARQVLLSDPYYAARATARGLNINSPDSVWTGQAATNPIEFFTYLGDPGTPHKTATLKNALNHLGFDMNETVGTSIDTEWMHSRRAMKFDMFTYIWPTGKLDPMTWMGVGMNLLYNSYALALPKMLYNFAMMQNSTIDSLMATIPWAGTAAQPMYNNLSTMILQEAPHLYISHAQRGTVVNAGWNVTEEALERGGGMFLALQWVGGARMSAAPPTPPLIPGFSSSLLVIFSLVTILGISFSITKKRRKL